MKISREWLQTYFDASLPEAKELADALTFHAFEIENVENDVLDVKVTPNRGHDALSHRGIAKEVSAILNIPLKADPLRSSVSLDPKTDAVKISVESAQLCPRFTGAVIRGVQIGPSPEWLQKRLESVGQKSINNVVDATNYVMFDIGQPLHAFDMGKLVQKNGGAALAVRLAKKDETLLGLDEKEYTLVSSMLVIEDAHAGAIASIAGIKGGKPTGIDQTTTDIFLEAANWDGATIRKTSQTLKLRTDASDRFQQVISPELAAYGTAAAAKLITELAGGKIAGYVDEYPQPQGKWEISVSTDRVNALLGTTLEDKDVAETFTRLDLPFEQKGSVFVVRVPFERLDLRIPADLVEEVARIVGYEKIPSAALPPFGKKPEVNPNFYATERVRENLMSEGFSEVYTSIFADEGERSVLNKVGGERPYLRSSLIPALRDAVARNVRNRIDRVKLFEIGTVWRNGKEEVVVAQGTENEMYKEETLLISHDNLSSYENLPVSEIERYAPFSKYPFIARDIALWVPAGTNADEVIAVIIKEAGPLLVRSEKFDEFKKDDKQSFAFRLILQSFDKTLTDAEANEVMGRVSKEVAKKGWTVR